MSKKILIVTEGVKPEKTITNIINHNLLPRVDLKNIVVYGNNIYKLYKDIESDPFSNFINTFEILEEYSDKSKNGNFFDKYSEEDFSYIYLFFDYDPWDSSFDSLKVSKMLELFNNPTEQGKLYINYPSSESFIHITDNFYKSIYNREIQGKYKTLVGEESNYSQIKKHTKEITLGICEKHLVKANLICNDLIDIPKDICQSVLYDKQRNLYSDKRDIFVISSFPSFVLDFLGYEEFLSLYEK
ncbi:hypothetical protein [Francisella philomiragia]|uniref:Uncharacterized protein n=1 Tax=Francisella philomiragia TaxID=28110 RepID=A0A0B6CX24_9GAMM|nr:hypothetical protein [Francisella philomiragia]AJI53400.1 hypothetical protein LA55_846 [Francisella philomiragia]